MIKNITKYQKTIATISGIAATFAFPPYYQIWILFAAFGSLMWLLNKTESCRHTFALGYCFGFGFFAFGLSWIANALALDIKSFGWLIPISFVASGAFFGLFTALPAMLTAYFRGIWSKIIIFATFWAVFEWLRSFLLTGFPWNLLSSALTFDHQLLQLSALVGPYGFSLLLCIIFSLPAAAFTAPYRRNALISAFLCIFLSGTIYEWGVYRTANLDSNNFSDIKIRVVQPSIPQNLKWDFGEQEKNFADYIEMSQAKGFEDSDVIIWGETASTFPIAIDRAHFYQLLPSVPDNGYLIVGSIDYHQDENERWLPVNAGLILRHGKGIIDSYAKSHLVPFGEYIPLRKWLPDSLRPITKVITDFKSGNGLVTYTKDGLPPFGLLICYEIIFPHHVIDNNNRPQWLINLTNDGWYGTGAGPYQHLAAAQLRAVEEGITIVRAANSGISALISPTGKIIASLALHKRGNLDFYLPQKLSLPTPYSQYGNQCFGIICLAAFFVASLLSLLAKRYK